MKNYLQGYLVFVGLLLVRFSAAESVDPRYPAKWHEQQAAESRPLKRWLPARIRQLEEEREQILQKIARLPKHDPKRLPDHLGYHSAVAEPDVDGVAPPHRLVASFRSPHELDSIALVPAFDSLDASGEPYAFPKRFKIEVQKAVGHWEQKRWIQQSTNWTEVVNWMEEDFPDPGPYPVFFSDISLNVTKIRLSVPHQTAESEAAFFALGEIYLFKNKGGEIADNMAVWGRVGIRFEVSDSFSMPPLWDAAYMYDGLAGLGVPLSEERVAAEDLMVNFDDDPAGDQVQLVLDLGQTQRVGRIELWPTDAPHRMAVPLFGFPGKVSVELSNDPDFKETKQIEIGNTGARMYHYNQLRIICEAYEARYIRLTLEELREYRGKRVLGLGEVSVSEHGRVYPIAQVAAAGIPAADLDQLPRLIDGTCRQHRIISEPEWIRGLAQRRPLDRRLAVVELELGQVREDWRVALLRMSIWGGCLLCVGFLSAMVLQRLQRRRVLKKMKLRITRDLHDEVGSSLGGLSLKSEVLESTASDTDVKKKAGELALLAREAYASLRDVVWMTDQDKLHLPELVEKLAERAQRVLANLELSIETSPHCPDVEVSLMFKRHLIMFFREAVYNCARHANASKVHVKIVADENDLQVLICDNGCGFDPRARQKGWGLDSMKKRAEEIRGEMTLKSLAGRGTTIALKVPVSYVSRDPKKVYKTSN